MRTCAYIKEGGERCRSRAMNGSDYCYGHDPAKATERSASAKRAGKAGGRGRAKPLSEEVGEIKGRLRGLVAAVLTGDPEKRVEKGDAIVLNQIFNTLLRAIEIERKTHETEELEVTLEELKEVVNEREGGRHAR
jgi:hypothetical protein